MTDRERSASEAELRQLIEQAPAAIAMVDRDMNYVAASRRYLSDFCLGDIIGYSHYEVFFQLHEHWKQVHRRCLVGMAEHCEKDSFVHADGRVQRTLWTIQAWHMDSGEIGGLLAFGADITERAASDAREAGRKPHGEWLLSTSLVQRKSGEQRFNSTCPKCGKARMQRYEWNSLLRLLNGGYAVEAYCSMCAEYWPISIKQRVSLGAVAVERVVG